MPLLVALPLHAEPQDAAAKKLANSAMNDDYLGTRFKEAEKKLVKARKQCGANKCSSSVVARIERDLGVVYIGGLKKPKPGKEAFAKAVQADPKIRLQADVTTPEIAAAWKEVGGETDDGGAQAETEEKVDLEPPKPEPEKTEPEAAASEYKQNWVSLSVQQDFLLHSHVRNACNSGSYTCFDASNTEYTGPFYSGYGNEVRAGLGFATTRILLGFDRVFFNKLLLGARLGFAFGGAPTPSSGDKFLPLHFEARAAFFPFGKKPFASDGLRPFASVGIGVAELDGSVGVDYYVDEAAYQAGQKGRLVAWRKTGKGMIAPGLGSQFAFGKSSAITLELRGMVMLGTSAFGPAVNLGYSHGI